MEAVPQRSKIALGDLVLMAVSDLTNQNLLASSITVQQHLTAKCEEMNIPSTSAIEYCLSQLQKQKKINYNNGGFRLELPTKINSPIVITNQKRPRPNPPVAKNSENNRRQPASKKSEKEKEKSNFFSSGLRRLRQTIRRKKGDEKPPQPPPAQKQNSDSGVDLSKSINHSVTSNSSTGVAPPAVTEERAYEMGYLNHRERQSNRLKNNRFNEVCPSDVESVASSRMSSRIKQKPKLRNGRRRRSKSSNGNSKYTSRSVLYI